eukprot:ANDGO_02874.mRNA.1 Protein AE7-like 1
MARVIPCAKPSSSHVSPTTTPYSDSVLWGPIATHSPYSTLLHHQQQHQQQQGQGQGQGQGRREQHSLPLSSKRPSFQSLLRNSIPEGPQPESGMMTPYVPDIPEESLQYTLDGCPVDADEIYGLLRPILDPEHSKTLEALGVIRQGCVTVSSLPLSKHILVHVQFIPTVKHCALASTIGLCLQHRIRESLTGIRGVKILVTLAPGSHDQETELNQQINDKERVAAALENADLAALVNRLVYPSDSY